MPKSSKSTTKPAKSVKTEKKPAGKRDYSAEIYQKVTDRMVATIEEAIASGGKSPWSRPWSGGGYPKNAISKKDYRGVNVFILCAAGFASPWWMTYDQAQSLGGQVRKGERSQSIIFWKIMKVNDKENPGKEKKIPLIHSYNVFNAEQCDWPEGSKKPADDTVIREFTPIEAAQNVLCAMPKPPALMHNEPMAYYSPMRDIVNMPKQELFTTPEGYYSTLYHELVHSTGHQSRLKREDMVKASSIFGKDNAAYSREELTAELGASMLRAVAGIETTTEEANSVAYLRGWLAALKADPKLLVSAAGLAQRAVDYIRGITYEEEVS